MAGLDQTDNVWDDFDFPEKNDRTWDDSDVEKKDDQQKTDNEKKGEKEKSEAADDSQYADDFEDNSDRDDSTRDGSVSTPRNTSHDKRDEVDTPPKERKSRKKHRHAHRKASSDSSNKPPPLNLYPDHPSRKHQPTRQRLEKAGVHDARRLPRNVDVMSDQENIRRGRKLHRRGQMRKFHSMEAAVEQAGRDRLEQKFQELEELMTRPLADRRGLHIPQRRLHKMVIAQQAHASLGHGDSPQGNGAVGPWFGDTVHEEEEEQDSHAYSTIRVLQTSGPSKHVNVRHQKVANRPGSARHRQDRSPRDQARKPHQEEHLSAKPPRPRRRKGSVESSPTSSSGTSQHRQDSEEEEEDTGNFRDQDHLDHDDHDTSPRHIYIPVDMHLKYSDNPKLREWLKRKNVEYRQQKKAERAKRREERNDKMVEEELKIARREKSAERVKEWMEMKRKEAVQRNKEERRRRKQQAQEQAVRQASRSPAGGVTGKRIDRPTSAPTKGSKQYIPIKRPDSAVKMDHGDGSAPKPPDSKFVYKRPVSGRVKLMKLQNERNARAKSADQQRYEALSPEEKEKRARMSYDAWLIAKRKEDQQKKKEAQRQKELIKSDPEMERIVPELAKRRIERIKNGKKHIDTGIERIDDQTNKSFGGSDFDEDGQKAITDGHHPADDIPRPSSYRLAVDGTAATLAEVNTRARPVSAKTRMPIPQSALSPRRPKSATPKVKAVMEKDQSAEPNPYKLPFPDHMGVPDHVRRVQEKIFSQDLIASANSERPEPQGCASVETGSCPKGVDGVQQEPGPRTSSSLVLLQEIEAAAVKSEQEKQLAEAADQQAEKTEEAQPAEEAEKDSSGSAANFSSDTEQVSEEKSAELLQESLSSPPPDTNLEPLAGATNVGGYEYDEEEEEDEEVAEVERTDEQQEQIPAPSFDENSPPESAKEADETSTEPKTSEAETKEMDRENAGTAEDKGDPQNAADADPDPPSISAESDSGKDITEDESSLRKSVTKHVSFSEDAPTVFKMEDTESSSNFDDERGSDDKEDESAYVSLDDAPL